MELKSTNSKFLELIEKEIINIIPKVYLPQIYEPFSYIMQSGGKRLRPLITMFSCGAVGAIPEDAAKCGAAMEILHNFTLVHDDIMDSSRFRRGRETVHIKWDDATAILTGDIMIAYAYKLLPNSNNHPNSIHIFSEMTEALIDVCEGQAIDMKFNSTEKVTMDEYFNMIELKTARLLMHAAAIGAFFGKADIEKVNALKEIFRNVGLAFQIQDDLLDMTASEQELGKKVGLDILEGKKTFMFILADELVNEPADRILIDSYFQSKGFSEEYIPIFDKIFKKYNIYELTNAKIEEFFNKAINYFSVLPENIYANMLKELMLSLNKRKY